MRTGLAILLVLLGLAAAFFLVNALLIAAFGDEVRDDITSARPNQAISAHPNAVPSARARRVVSG